MKTLSIAALLVLSVFALSAGNLVGNGDFALGIDGWTPDSKIYASTSGNILTLEYSGGKPAMLSQRIGGLITGKKYTLSFDAKIVRRKGNETGLVSLADAKNESCADLRIDTADWKKYEKTFIAEKGFDRLTVGATDTICFMLKNVSLYAEETSAKTFSGKIETTRKDGGFGITTPFVKAELAAKGGKLVSLRFAGGEWAEPSGNRKIQGLGKLWFNGPALDDATDTAVDYKLEQSAAGSGAAVFTATGSTELFNIRKIYTFHANQKIGLTVELTNRMDRELAFSVRIHHYLPIFRTGTKTPLFRLFASLRKGMCEYRMIEDCPPDIELKDADFVAVVDSGNRSFVTEAGKKADYYIWSGHRKDKGTVELKTSNIRLKPGEKLLLNQNLYFVTGLPSVGRVDRDFIFSVSDPEFNLISLSGIKNFEAVLRTAGGSSYPCSRALLSPGEVVNVALSSIADPGARTFSYEDRELSIPSYSDVFPVDTSGSEPCGWIRKYGNPIPKPPFPDSLIYFPSDYYQMNTYASPDAITMIAFGQSAVGSPSGRAGLHFYVPEGIVPLGGRFIRSVERLPDETIDGKKLTHYRIQIGYSLNATRPGVTELLVRCMIPAPAEFDAWYATEHNGRLSPKGKTRLNIIHIPEAGVPKKMYTAFWGLHGTLDLYPDAEAFSRIGFRYPDEKYLRDIVKSGLLASCPAAQGYLRFPAKDRDSWSLDRNGRKSGELACPTYRGRGVREYIEAGKAAIDNGVMIHGFDPERTNGLEVCFCPRCVELFGEHASSRGFRMPPGMTRETLVEMCGRNAALEKLRLEFMIQKEMERYKLYADTMRAHGKAKGLPASSLVLAFAARSEVSDAPDRIRSTSYEDIPSIGNIFDNYSPMDYIDIKYRFIMKTDLAWLHREIKAYYRLGGPGLNVVPTLSAGYPYSDFIGNIEPGVMKAQILEVFASGARGFQIYSEGWYDALDMKQTGEAMKIILQAEELFLTGRPIPDDRIVNEAKNTFVKGIETIPGDAVILVSDYSRHAKEAVVRYSFDGEATVTDMETGRRIAEISSSNPGFKVTLTSERARMFRIEKKK